MKTLKIFSFAVFVTFFGVGQSEAQIIKIIDSIPKSSTSNTSKSKSQSKLIIKDSLAVVVLEFDETGKMISAPPSSITDNTVFKVTVNTTTASLQSRIIAAHDRYISVLNNLDKLDADGKPAILNSFGLKYDTGEYKRADSILKVVKYKVKNQLILLLKDTLSSVVLKNKMDVYSELEKLKKYDIDSGEYSGLIKLFNIPDINSLTQVTYLLHITTANVNGLLNQLKCDTTIKFTIEKSCCNLSYSTKYFKIFGMGRGPVKYDFELRQNNNVFEQLTSQITNNKLLSNYNANIIKIDTIKNQVSNVLNFKTPSGTKLVPDSLNTLLNTWLKSVNSSKSKASPTDKKNTQATKDSKAAQEPKLTADEFNQLINNLYEIHNTILSPLKTDTAIAWVFQFSWISSGQNITANPLVSTNTDDGAKSISTFTKSLKNFEKDSLSIVQRLSLLENISKTSGKVDINIIDTAYKNVLKEKRKYQDTIGAILDTIAKLKAKQLSINSSNLHNTNAILNDSLLYSGFFYVNHQIQSTDFGEWWLRPNKPYYAYMRHHNALEDYHLMGREPVKEINEKQRMFILVENAKSNAKYTLKTTVTSISLSADVDQPGSAIAAIPQFIYNTEKSLTNLKIDSSSKKPTPPNLDSLSKAYQKAKKESDLVLAPYKNGVLTMPIQPVKDQTPNYVTKMISHQETAVAPSMIGYAILDSATSKNLNSEQAVYNYRYNKLYRFRLKAGFAYSWMERKNYTINATTNTATYTENYTNLGPSFGVQIFTSKIDIQKQRLFPTGIYPYIYVGYLFSDAPANNFLLGGGWEIFSGFAITGGVHIGKSQKLTVLAGALETKDYFKTAPFVSLSIGLEAFSAIFNTASTIKNPFKTP